MKQFKIQHAFIFKALLAMLIFVAACSKEDVQYDTPQISIDGENTVNSKPGETVQVSLELNGAGGAKSVVVKKNGGFLQEFTVNNTATQFVYTTEPLSQGLAEGDTEEYSFLLSNLNGVDSEEVTFTISVALYNEITVGNTTLYNLAVGTDGVVSSGEVSLIKGRNYYIPYAIDFDPGSTLTVEEGVHLYMNADADTPVGIVIKGEANIVGTAESPVVMTSSRVLETGAEASPGDWSEFRITGEGGTSNNGVLRYIRMEYGDNRAFRLTNVGSATQVEYIQVYKTAGEGVMFTDGNARVKYIVATDCEGGSYRLGDAYEGMMQFVISVNSGFFDDNDDFTIREDAAPIIANATILGGGADLEDNTHGMRFRANAAPKVYNTILAEFPRRALRAGDNVEITDLNGSAVFAYSYIFSVPRDPFRDLATAFAGTFDEEGLIENNVFHNNVVSISGSTYELNEIAGIGVADFVPDAAQSSAFNPSTLNSFFSSADFVGAVKNANEDWTKGWVKNPDGSIR